MMQDTTGIIGGGVAGLALAYGLSQHGMKSVVFDTGKHTVGGRCSSKLVKKKNGEKIIVDHACQLFTVSNNENMQKMIKEMERDGAVTKMNNIVQCNMQNYDFKHVDNSRLYGGNAQLGINSIVQWLVEKCKNNILIHQDVWISKLIRNISSEKTKTTSSWTLGGKKKKDNFGPYNYCVIAHNGKCADRLIRTSNVKTLAHPILKCKFVSSGTINKKVKYLELKSLFVVIVEIDYDLNDLFTGCFVNNSNVLSFIMNNTRKYNRKGTNEQVWTLISTAEYASKNKCPQETIPIRVRKKVTKEMCNEFFKILDKHGNVKQKNRNKFNNSKSNANQTRETRTSITQMLNENHHIIHIQLWGAALSCNTMTQGNFLNDVEHQIGIVGDWFLKPSIEGSILSGMALADALKRDRCVATQQQELKLLLKDTSLLSSARKGDTTFSKYSSCEIGSFDNIANANNKQKKNKKKSNKKDNNINNNNNKRNNNIQNPSKTNDDDDDSSNNNNNNNSDVTKPKSKHDKNKNNISKKKGDSNGKKMKNVRPNYFLSVRIKNEILKQRAQHVIDLAVMLDGDDVKKCIVPTRDLHLTLFVFHLKGREQIEKASEVLASTHDKINQIIGPDGLSISFANVSSFRKDVIYIDVVQDKAYEKLVEMSNYLHKEFYKKGIICDRNIGEILSDDSNIPTLKLKPHATLLKTSKAKFKKKEKRRRIYLTVPEIVKERYFGVANFDRVELSAMMKKDSEGYYACRGFVKIDNTKKEELQDEDEIEKLLSSMEGMMKKLNF